MSKEFELAMENIIELITSLTGIIPKDSHKTGIINFVEKRLKEKKLASEDYCVQLVKDKGELELLINSATVNETYFFREEPQFILLKEKLLPELKLGLLDKTNPLQQKTPLKIWSAAVSSGEEIYSLYLLAKSLGIDCLCSASDINTAMLEICKSGKYKARSCRTVDGSAFHYLLKDYKMEDGSYEIPSQLCQQIDFKRVNLFKMKDAPVNQHIIFLRNVFIYFDSNTRKKILNTIVNECLAPGGYLFVSINEIASIDNSIIPEKLEKLSDGKVFYFRKKMEYLNQTEKSKEGR